MPDFIPKISETEQSLADHLSRLTSAKWHQSVSFKTSFCEFFLDMGCRVKEGRAIGLECDGTDFHKDKVREFCRDALILETRRLACIYHIEAWAVRVRQFDWLFILGKLEPDLFTREKLETIKGLVIGYDQYKSLKFKDRSIRFMSWRTPDDPDVKSFLEFAKRMHGFSFPTLVEQARATDRWPARRTNDREA
jgi:hypothetical protein